MGVDIDPDQPQRRETYAANRVGVACYYPLSRGAALTLHAEMHVPVLCRTDICLLGAYPAVGAVADGPQARIGHALLEEKICGCLGRRSPMARLASGLPL